MWYLIFFFWHAVKFVLSYSGLFSTLYASGLVLIVGLEQHVSSQVSLVSSDVLSVVLGAIGATVK